MDATAAGFVVHWNDTESLRNGQWVKVTGRLKRISSPEDLSPLVQLPGTYFTVLQPRYLFSAEHVQPIEAPEVPFSYELRDTEPYAY